MKGRKNKLGNELIPVAKYYFIGYRNINILHTELNLIQTYYIRVLLNSPSKCRSSLEDAIHFIMECPLYFKNRIVLFRQIQQLTDFTVDNVLVGNDRLLMIKTNNIKNHSGLHKANQAIYMNMTKYYCSVLKIYVHIAFMFPGQTNHN